MIGRRVVLTGLGIISPLGLNVNDTWEAILNGRSGAKPITNFDVSNYSTKFSASVAGFDPANYFDAKEARKMDSFIQYGMVAGIEAVEDSGLLESVTDLSRVGVAIGSGIGGIGQIEKNRDILLSSGPRKISPFFVPGSIINMVSGNLSIKYGFEGPNLSVVTACASGTHTVGLGARLICYGDADAMLVGGAEMATTPVGLAGFAAARALSKLNDYPESASRPWDKDRDGFVLGDGAGVLLLEEYEHAKKRKATIYAELAGFGMSGDAHHMTLPPENGEGAAKAMNQALLDAKVNKSDVDYINAHGTSTPAGDLAESTAIKEVLGESAKMVSVSSTKSMTGHLLGAAGAIEAIFSALSIRDQVVPPTINLENPSEGCDLDFTPQAAKERVIRNVISNSFGFGGTNGTILLSQHS